MLRRFASPGLVEILDLGMTKDASVGKRHAAFLTLHHLVARHFVAFKSLFTLINPPAFSQVHTFHVLI